MAIKPGGLNVRNDEGCEKKSRSEVAERGFCGRRHFWDVRWKADVVREVTGERTRRDNVGKGHLPAGTGNNLQRPMNEGKTEGRGRAMV